MKLFSILLLFLAVFILNACGEEKVAEEEPLGKPKAAEESSESAPPPVEDENKYKLGSLCNYCSYCKLCKLCDKDCPCKTSRKKPNCDLCKYCKYCSLCSVCDVACKPGGIVDVVSSAIYSSLPSFSKKEKEEVDKDIEKARDFIKEYL
ncbi:sarcoplasmic reticulum histidine-rich calcium-binding protein [Nematostella vectensis]|nr:sarcoplasmic reticulum histidine-rich calcium-binding protein [Nematostella vectensis]